MNYIDNRKTMGQRLLLSIFENSGRDTDICPHRHLTLRAAARILTLAIIIIIFDFCAPTPHLLASEANPKKLLQDNHFTLSGSSLRSTTTNEFQSGRFITSPSSVTASTTTSSSEIHRIGEITEYVSIYKKHRRKASPHTATVQDKKRSIICEEIPITWKKLIPASWAKYPVGGIGFNPKDRMTVYETYPVEVAIYPKDLREYARGDLLRAFKDPEFAQFTSLKHVGPSMKMELYPLTPRSFEVSPNTAIRVDLAGTPVTRTWSVTPIEPGTATLVLRVSIVAPNQLAGPEWCPEMIVLERMIKVEVGGTFRYYLKRLLREAESHSVITLLTLISLITGIVAKTLQFRRRSGK